MITETLTKLEYHSFYRNQEDNLSICEESIWTILGKYPTNPIRIQAAAKNPRKKGWFKVTHLVDNEQLVTPFGTFGVHTRLFNYLVSSNLGNCFYVKIDERSKNL